MGEDHLIRTGGGAVCTETEVREGMLEDLKEILLASFRGEEAERD